ncbi:MAG: HD domain-containing protein [Candidatus Fermentibacteraceae bacterium]
MADSGISPADARDLFRQYVRSESLYRHCLATAAIMGELARAMNEGSPETWESAGMLHDIDMELVGDDHSKHGIMAGKMLEGFLPEPFIHAIVAHNGQLNGTVRTSDLDYLLSAAESVTGLISATALIYPERKLEPVEAGSVVKRMGKSGFARNVDRARIIECTLAGFRVDDFVELALKAMKRIAPELGI